MKKGLSGILCSLLVLVAFSCASPEEKSEKAQKRAQESVFDAYINLKNALVESDYDEAVKEAGNVKKELEEINTVKMTPEAIEEWNKQAGKMRGYLDQIQSAKGLKEQRDAFKPLSEAMYDNIQKFGLSSTETVYYQFCPMAMGGDGANWLSEEPEVNNPYYGDEMLHCGTNEDTLKLNIEKIDATK